MVTKSKGEKRKLSSSQCGWQLHHAGQRHEPVALPRVERARGGGTATSNMATESIDSETEGDADDEAEEEDDIATSMPLVRRPPKAENTRVLIEVAQLEKVFDQLGCPNCGEPLKMSVQTVCVATSIGMECTSQECTYLFHPQQPVATTIHGTEDDKDDNYERSTDYAVNVLYVLGFLSMGDGPTEAGRLLGLLGLPNDTTMESRSFGIIEERVAYMIRELCDEIIRENIVEEAKASMELSDTQDEFDFQLWLQSLEDDTMGPLPLGKYPRLDGSYDMAWQQKGSGHQYNSQSGHGTLMGALTRKVIGLCIKSKICNHCNAWDRKNPGLPNIVPHQCWKTHNGSSGSMESAACLELVVDCYRSSNCIIRSLCCDDDSSIRADCQWSNADYLMNNKTTVLPQVPKTKGMNKGKLQQRPDKGILPFDVPEPKFVADPNHRRKGLTGELIKLSKMRKSIKHTMTRMDATRIGKNFGYMARTLRTRDEAEYVNAAKAVLEHHFDNHEFCGAWCKRQSESIADRDKSRKYHYRCKEKDAKLYVILQATLERFITQDKLLEMAHTLDTNMNEAFNQICTWFAPKNKVFAGAYSLHNRIAFAVGINSVGVLLYFTRLYRKLGVTMTDNVKHYLTVKDVCRSKKLAKVKTNEAKKAKNQKKHLLLTEQTLLAKIERRKRCGTYRPGMNLDDSDEASENDLDAAPAKKKRKAKAKGPPTSCEFCGNKGHATTRAKKCTFFGQAGQQKLYRKVDGSLLSGPPNPVVIVAPAQQQEDPADPMVVGVNALHVLAGGLNEAADDYDDCDRDDRLPLVPHPDDEDSDSDSEDDGIEEGQMYFDYLGNDNAPRLHSSSDSDEDDSSTSSTIQQVGIMRATL
jgi:hypothetical protein